MMRRAATGLSGLWQRVRGKRAREEEAQYTAMKRSELHLLQRDLADYFESRVFHACL